MKKNLNLLVLALTAGVLFSCDKDKDKDKAKPAEPEAKVSSLQMQFDNRFGTEALELDKTYRTASNDQVKFARAGYFISNVELVNADGSVFKEPNSYHLIWVEDNTEKETFKIDNVPAGDYTKVRFMVGIDSVRNATIANATGDLSPDNHMTWMWDTGFIFFHSKGFYVHPDSSQAQLFTYDVGKNRSLRQVELTLPNTTRVDLDNNPKVVVNADLKATFGGPNVINVVATPFIAGTPEFAAASKLVADNYATMFKIQSVTK